MHLSYVRDKMENHLLKQPHTSSANWSNGNNFFSVIDHGFLAHFTALIARRLSLLLIGSEYFLFFAHHQTKAEKIVRLCKKSIASVLNDAINRLQICTSPAQQSCIDEHQIKAN